jgi:hypothetical protein
MKLWCHFLVFTLGFVLPAHAYRGDTQKARFAPWFEILRTPLSAAVSAEDAVIRLEGTADARVAAFNLQALGYIYSDKDNDFEEFAEAFEQIEDGLGKIDEEKAALAAARAQKQRQEVLDRLSADVKEAEARFAETLREQGWVHKGKRTTFEKQEEFISEYDWSKKSKDRLIVLNAIRDQLRLVQDKYDMSRLNKGKASLHRFRRQVRWALIEARVVNGVVAFRPDDNDCPLNAYRELLSKPIATSKYSSLPQPPSDVRPCRISRCLFLAHVDAVEQMGLIKDRIEAANKISQKSGEELSDSVPDTERKLAEAVYRTLVDGGAVAMLRGQLEECIKED